MIFRISEIISKLSFIVHFLSFFIRFTFPDGQAFDLKFVADQGGYQPQSSWLPVAPAFPHPIPQFVLDQIEKARLEDAQGQRYDAPAPPSNRYSSP